MNKLLNELTVSLGYPMSFLYLLPNIFERELKWILEHSIFSRTGNEEYHVWLILSYIVEFIPPKVKKIIFLIIVEGLGKSNMLVIIEIGEIHPKLLFSGCRKAVKGHLIKHLWSCFQQNLKRKKRELWNSQFWLNFLLYHLKLSAATSNFLIPESYSV